jgi:hypothetical protein
VLKIYSWIETKSVGHTCTLFLKIAGLSKLIIHHMLPTLSSDKDIAWRICRLSVVSLQKCSPHFETDAKKLCIVGWRMDWIAVSSWDVKNLVVEVTHACVYLHVIVYVIVVERRNTLVMCYVAMIKTPTKWDTLLYYPVNYIEKKTLATRKDNDPEKVSHARTNTWKIDFHHIEEKQLDVKTFFTLCVFC